MPVWFKEGIEAALLAPTAMNQQKFTIGIPALVTDDGKLTLDWESFFTEQGIEVVHPGEAGAACGIDGKGC